MLRVATFVLVAAALVPAVALPSTTTRPTAVCSPRALVAGTCNIANNGGRSVDIVGVTTSPSQQTDRSARPASPNRSQPSRPGASAPSRPQLPQLPPPPRRNPLETCPAGETCVAPFQVNDTPVAEPDPDEPATADPIVIPAVTLSDVASFAPATPPLAAEPGTITVRGMPTNFVARMGEHTVDGELFGFPVTVHFAPHSYLFDYGDGTTRVTTTGGERWEDLGLPQFSATETSHAYGERGTFTATISARYTASVSFFGNPWIPVDGLVTIASAGQSLDVLEVRTALVDKTCTENPAGPGC